MTTWIRASDEVKFQVIKFLSARDLVRLSMSGRLWTRDIESNMEMVLSTRQLSVRDVPARSGRGTREPPSTRRVLRFLDRRERAFLFENFGARVWRSRWMPGPTSDSTTSLSFATAVMRGDDAVFEHFDCDRYYLCGIKDEEDEDDRCSLSSFDNGREIAVTRDSEGDRATIRFVRDPRAPKFGVSIENIRRVSIPRPRMSAVSLRFRGGRCLNFNGIYHRFDDAPIRPASISFKYRVNAHLDGVRGFFNVFLSSDVDPNKDLEAFYLGRPPSPADTFSCLISTSGDRAPELWLPSGLRVPFTDDRPGMFRRDNRWHCVEINFDWTRKDVFVRWDGKLVGIQRVVRSFGIDCRFHHPFTFQIRPGDRDDYLRTRTDTQKILSVARGFRYIYLFTWLEERNLQLPDISVTDIIVQP